MNLLLALYRYFSGGGLQNDTLRFAQEAARRGHHVTILCTSWEGEPPQDIEVVIRPVHAWTNHGAMKHFARTVTDYRLTHPIDVSLAMNRIPGCDAYFVADSCLASTMPERHHPLILSCLPRYCAFLRQEALVCSPHAHTQLLYIAQPQLQDYSRIYHLPPERLVYLPPGMDGRCRLHEDSSIRQTLRTRLGLPHDTTALVLVGTNLQRKGADRALQALVSLPADLKAHFFLIGMDAPGKVAKLAAMTGVDSARFTFLGARHDVPDLLQAMDLMVHPAREEGTGTVLVEAIASGLPVICSGACGFASFVQEATDTVLQEPFRQQELNDLLASSIRRLAELKRLTRQYAATQDFTARSRVAVDRLETLAKARHQLNLAVLCPAPATLPTSPLPPELTDVCQTLNTAWTTLHVLPIDLLNRLPDLHDQCVSDRHLLLDTPELRVSRVTLEGVSRLVREYRGDRRPAWLSPAWHSWNAHQSLRGFAMPCLALAEQRHRRLLVLADPGDDSLTDAGSRPQRHDLLLAAGSLLASLHEHGLFLLHASADSIALNDRCPWMPSPLLLADGGNLRKLRWLSRRHRARNLAQLLASLKGFPDDTSHQVTSGYQLVSNFDDLQMQTLLEEVAAALEKHIQD